MNNVEKLRQIGILGQVRQNLGASNEEDESFDVKIERMSNTALIKSWCAWNIGDGSWWIQMKSMFDNLEAFDKEI